MELNIGSNIIRNTNGVLSIQGKDQIFLEIGENDEQLLLTMDLYNSLGKHVAKMRRNAWVFNNEDEFEVTTSPASLKLIQKGSGNILLEASVIGRSRINIMQGRFYTSRGHLLEITPHYWRIGGLTMGGNVIDSCGGAVSIG